MIFKMLPYYIFTRLNDFLLSTYFENALNASKPDNDNEKIIFHGYHAVIMKVSVCVIFLLGSVLFEARLSPAIILMSGVAHDGGILQSRLFTSRSQNLVSGKLRRSGFWS